MTDTRRLRALVEDRDLVVDEVALAAAKYQVVVAVEGASRVAQHLVVAEGRPVAESNADAFRRLASEGVLPAGLAERLARAVGFRNLLVHRATEVQLVGDGQAVPQQADVDGHPGTVAPQVRWCHGG